MSVVPAPEGPARPRVVSSPSSYLGHKRRATANFDSMSSMLAAVDSVTAGDAALDAALSNSVHAAIPAAAQPLPEGSTRTNTDAGVEARSAAASGSPQWDTAPQGHYFVQQAPPQQYVYPAPDYGYPISPSSPYGASPQFVPYGYAPHPGYAVPAPYPLHYGGAPSPQLYAVDERETVQAQTPPSEGEGLRRPAASRRATSITSMSQLGPSPFPRTYRSRSPDASGGEQQVYSDGEQRVYRQRSSSPPPNRNGYPVQYIQGPPPPHQQVYYATPPPGARIVYDAAPPSPYYAYQQPIGYHPGGGYYQPGPPPPQRGRTMSATSPGSDGGLVYSPATSPPFRPRQRTMSALSAGSASSAPGISSVLGGSSVASGGTPATSVTAGTGGAITPMMLSPTGKAPAHYRPGGVLQGMVRAQSPPQAQSASASATSPPPQVQRQGSLLPRPKRQSTISQQRIPNEAPIIPILPPAPVPTASSPAAAPPSSSSEPSQAPAQPSADSTAPAPAKQSPEMARAASITSDRMATSAQPQTQTQGTNPTGIQLARPRQPSSGANRSPVSPTVPSWPPPPPPVRRMSTIPMQRPSKPKAEASSLGRDRSSSKSRSGAGAGADVGGALRFLQDGSGNEEGAVEDENEDEDAGEIVQSPPLVPQQRRPDSQPPLQRPQSPQAHRNPQQQHPQTQPTVGTIAAGIPAPEDTPEDTEYLMSASPDELDGDLELSVTPTVASIAVEREKESARTTSGDNGSNDEDETKRFPFPNTSVEAVKDVFTASPPTEKEPIKEQKREEPVPSMTLLTRDIIESLDEVSTPVVLEFHEDGDAVAEVAEEPEEVHAHDSATAINAVGPSDGEAQAGEKPPGVPSEETAHKVRFEEEQSVTEDDMVSAVEETPLPDEKFAELPEEVVEPSAEGIAVSPVDLDNAQVASLPPDVTDYAQQELDDHLIVPSPQIAVTIGSDSLPETGEKRGLVPTDAVLPEPSGVTDPAADVVSPKDTGTLVESPSEDVNVPISQPTPSDENDHSAQPASGRTDSTKHVIEPLTKDEELSLTEATVAAQDLSAGAFIPGHIAAALAAGAISDTPIEIVSVKPTTDADRDPSIVVPAHANGNGNGNGHGIDATKQPLPGAFEHSDVGDEILPVPSVRTQPSAASFAGAIFSGSVDGVKPTRAAEAAHEIVPDAESTVASPITPVTDVHDVSQLEQKKLLNESLVDPTIEATQTILINPNSSDALGSEFTSKHEDEATLDTVTHDSDAPVPRGNVLDPLQHLLPSLPSNTPHAIPEAAPEATNAAASLGAQIDAGAVLSGSLADDKAGVHEHVDPSPKAADDAPVARDAVDIVSSNLSVVGYDNDVSFTQDEPMPLSNEQVYDSVSEEPTSTREDEAAPTNSTQAEADSILPVLDEAAVQQDVPPALEVPGIPDPIAEVAAPGSVEPEVIASVPCEGTTVLEVASAPELIDDDSVGESSVPPPAELAPSTHGGVDIDHGDYPPLTTEAPAEAPEMVIAPVDETHIPAQELDTLDETVIEPETALALDTLDPMTTSVAVDEVTYGFTDSETTFPPDDADSSVDDVQLLAASETELSPTVPSPEDTNVQEATIPTLTEVVAELGDSPREPSDSVPIELTSLADDEVNHDDAVLPLEVAELAPAPQISADAPIDETVVPTLDSEEDISVLVVDEVVVEEEALPAAQAPESTAQVHDVVSEEGTAASVDAEEPEVGFVTDNKVVVVVSDEVPFVPEGQIDSKPVDTLSPPEDVAAHDATSLAENTAQLPVEGVADTESTDLTTAAAETPGRHQSLPPPPAPTEAVVELSINEGSLPVRELNAVVPALAETIEEIVAPSASEISDEPENAAQALVRNSSDADAAGPAAPAPALSVHDEVAVAPVAPVAEVLDITPRDTVEEIPEGVVGSEGPAGPDSALSSHPEEQSEVDAHGSIVESAVQASADEVAVVGDPAPSVVEAAAPTHNETTLKALSTLSSHLARLGRALDEDEKIRSQAEASGVASPQAGIADQDGLAPRAAPALKLVVSFEDAQTQLPNVGTQSSAPTAATQSRALGVGERRVVFASPVGTVVHLEQEASEGPTPSVGTPPESREAEKGVRTSYGDALPVQWGTASAPPSLSLLLPSDPALSASMSNPGTKALDSSAGKPLLTHTPSDSEIRAHPDDKSRLNTETTSYPSPPPSDLELHRLDSETDEGSPEQLPRALEIDPDRLVRSTTPPSEPKIRLPVSLFLVERAPWPINRGARRSSSWFSLLTTQTQTHSTPESRLRQLEIATTIQTVPQDTGFWTILGPFLIDMTLEILGLLWFFLRQVLYPRLWTILVFLASPVLVGASPIVAWLTNKSNDYSAGNVNVRTSHLSRSRQRKRRAL